MYKIIGADQKEYGPVTADQLRQWIVQGRINAQTLVQAEGQTDWRPLSSYPEFATVATLTAAPAPGFAPLMPSASDAASRVSGPATGLMVVGILFSLMAVLGLLSRLLGWGMMAFDMNRPGMRELPPHLVRMLQDFSRGTMAVIFGVIQLALSLFVVFASTKMRKLKSHGMVLTAAILSMIPCLTPSCCCVIGLPVGIWTLVVLSKPEVKSAFH